MRYKNEVESLLSQPISIEGILPKNSRFEVITDKQTGLTATYVLTRPISYKAGLKKSELISFVCEDVNFPTDKLTKNGFANLRRCFDRDALYRLERVASSGEKIAIKIPGKPVIKGYVVNRFREQDDSLTLILVDDIIISTKTFNWNSSKNGGSVIIFNPKDILKPKYIY